MAQRMSRAAGLLAGKIRRFMLVRFRPGYVAQQAAHREGDCNRCGRCCEILLRCPFLIKEEGGDSRCRIYGRRFEQCVAFPIDDRDLADVDFNCTYSFPKMRLFQIDTPGVQDQQDGRSSGVPPRRRVWREGLRKAGIVQMVAAALAVFREKP